MYLQSLNVWNELHLVILTAEDDVRWEGGVVPVEYHLPCGGE